MKTGDEMFKELGYEKDSTYLSHLDYHNNILEKTVSFRNDKTIGVFNYYDSFEPITINELQAINKKCQELGWI